MSTHHTVLFHRRLVRQRMAQVDPDRLAQARPVVDVWLDHLARGTLHEQSEVKVHAPFLTSLFGKVLGYRTLDQALDGQWNLSAEEAVHRGSIDGALGLFRPASEGPPVVIAPIELKGSTHPLDHARGRGMTPVEQAWSYGNKTPESRWIIVSNYRETRLYSKRLGAGAYELFTLDELQEDKGLRRFIALLGRDALLGAGVEHTSPLTELLVASEREELAITSQLYREYREVRQDLFHDVRKAHPDRPPGELLTAVQTIMDRVLFVAFA